MRRYRDRTDAGERLADAAADRFGAATLADPIVLALPRGGVPVAAPVARRLGAALDVFVVRKIGAPGHREYAIGAIAQDGDPILGGHDPDLFGIDRGALERVIAEERAELARRVERYRPGLPPLRIEGRSVLVVDDGMATGSTAIAALDALRARRPARLVMLTPVAPPDTIERVRTHCDDVVCPLVRYDFRAVGQWYRDFDQTTDADVLRLLGRDG